MTENGKDSKTSNISVPREELLNTAVKFLQNSSVQKTSLTHRQAFLRSKGLTDEEIRIACERSEAFTAQKKQLQTLPPSYTAVPVNSAYSQVIAPQSLWSKIRDIINTLAIIGGISYGLYILYKKYIAPIFFGKKKRKSVEESISDLEKSVTSSVQQLNEGLSKVHVDLEQVKENQQQWTSPDVAATARQVEDLKADIASVKGLLLSRNQFAPPVAKSPLVPPSIPDWQRSASEAAKEADDEGAAGGKDADIELCTSGSGSSETEMVTHNGSDSSLEMIRE